MLKLQGPLQGVKVLDLSTYAASPSCSRLLAYLGADVIHVESIQGDPLRVLGRLLQLPIEDDENPVFEINNADKRGIAIDLKSEEGKEILHKLLEKTDVFVTNFRNKAIEKLGLSYEQLSTRFPGLIYGQVNGYGTKGKLVDKPGFDYSAYITRSGFSAGLIEPDAPPMAAHIGVGDLPTAVILALGVLAALHGRNKHGKGDKVDVSLYHAGIYSMALELAASEKQDRVNNSAINPKEVLGCPYKCKDNKWIVFVAPEHERFWPIVCKAMGREDLINERYNSMKEMCKNVKELHEIMTAEIVQKNRDEWEKILTEADVPYEIVQTLYEVNHDEQALVNGFFHEVTFTNGSKRMLATPPLQLASYPMINWNHAPLLGEHTAEVLSELGYTQQQIDVFADKKVIKVN